MKKSIIVPEIAGAAALVLQDYAKPFRLINRDGLYLALRPDFPDVDKYWTDVSHYLKNDMPPDGWMYCMTYSGFYFARNEEAGLDPLETIGLIDQIMRHSTTEGLTANRVLKRFMSVHPVWAEQIDLEDFIAVSRTREITAKKITEMLTELSTAI